MPPPAAAHDPRTGDTLAAVRAFIDAFNRHDVDAIMDRMTRDCVFEDTRPAPDGRRFEGELQVRMAWEQLFRRSPQARFDTDDLWAAGDRCVVQWTYHWVRDGQPGRVRGVDLIRVREGKVAEKLSYVKG